MTPLTGHGQTFAGIACALALAGLAAAPATRAEPIGIGAVIQQATPPPSPAPDHVARLVARTGTPGAVIPVAAPSTKHGGYLVRVNASTYVRRAPADGPRVWTARPTTAHTHGATQLMVLAAKRDSTGQAWLRVALPIRPVGTSGWIPASAVTLARTTYYVRVRLARRDISVYARGRRVLTAAAVIGKPSTPTPRGLFAIYEEARQADPHGFIGPWALHLTALSRVLDNYGGGPGRVAIHGRDGASLSDPLGSARSHGCVRVADTTVQWLRSHLTVGTPVRISSN